MLKQNGWKVDRKVKNSAPSIVDRQNSVRSKIKNALGESSLLVNINKCKILHQGLSNLKFKKGSTFLEEDAEYQHITTAIGYGIEFEWPIVFDVEKKDINNYPQVHYWKNNRR